MGLDFIRKAAKSFHKSLDESRVTLGTPTLFTKDPKSEARSYVASVRGNTTVVVNDAFCVRADGSGGVVALRGLEPVADFSDPPKELLDALRESHGEASGTTLKVHELAGMVEIAVC